MWYILSQITPTIISDYQRYTAWAFYFKVLYYTERHRYFGTSFTLTATSVQHPAIVSPPLPECSTRYLYIILDQYSVVVIATPYGLGGQGIESWWGWCFLHPFRPALRPTPPPKQRVRFFPRGRAVRRGANHPTPSIAQVKERVELYIFSPLWAFSDLF